MDDISIIITYYYKLMVFAEESLIQCLNHVFPQMHTFYVYMFSYITVQKPMSVKAILA